MQDHLNVFLLAAAGSGNLANEHSLDLSNLCMRSQVSNVHQSAGSEDCPRGNTPTIIEN
jgi:hypothetical protein